MEVSDENLFVPNETYLKSGVHIGTKFKTKHMEKFIYKTRSDGLSVLDIQSIDDRLKIAAKFLAQYNPEEILIVSRRENGWRAVKLFAKLTGVKHIAGRYLPGILTNTSLKTFMQVKVILVVDPWPDRNAIYDAQRVGIPTIALCDTNNDAKNIDLVIPCNNKGKKSLGIVFWVLSNLFLREKGLLNQAQFTEQTLEQFSEE